VVRRGEQRDRGVKTVFNTEGHGGPRRRRRKQGTKHGGAEERGKDRGIVLCLAPFSSSLLSFPALLNLFRTDPSRGSVSESLRVL
jgi:hypothetical protein